MLVTLLVIWIVVIPAVTVVAGFAFTELRNRNNPQVARTPASRQYVTARKRHAASGDRRLFSL